MAGQVVNSALVPPGIAGPVAPVPGAATRANVAPINGP
jgi:hypothetical protein